MAWLNRELAQWELYEVGAGSDDLESIDTADQGNLKMRLVHAFNPQAAIERAQDGVAHVMRLLPPGMQSRVTVAARSANEVGLSLYGLEFARVRQGFVADSFDRQANVTFGAGANETPLLEETEAGFAELMQQALREPSSARAARAIRSFVCSRNRGSSRPWPAILAGSTTASAGASSTTRCPPLPAADRAMLDLAYGYPWRAAGDPGIESG